MNFWKNDLPRERFQLVNELVYTETGFLWILIPSYENMKIWKRLNFLFWEIQKRVQNQKKEWERQRKGGGQVLGFFFSEKKAWLLSWIKKKFVHIGQFDHISRFETLFAITLAEAECKNAKQLWKPMKINKK